MRKSLLILLFVMTCTQAWGATRYVRVDGGNSTQCTGLTDSSVAQAVGTACAMNSPHWVFPSTGESTSRAAAAGDTVVIKSGEYRIGCQNSTNCRDSNVNLNSAGNCSNTFSYDCNLGTIPSNVTVIGCSTSGCASESQWPKLFGAGSVSEILNVQGKTGVTLKHLELTDKHNGGHNHQTMSVGCTGGSHPTLLSAMDGIRMAGASNLTMTGLNIHGVCRYGLYGQINGLSATDVKINFNSFGGWNSDTCSNTANCPNDGIISFTGSTPVTSTYANNKCSISWNGCIENWQSPGTPVSQGCYTQTVGGYGDGIGTAATKGTWTFNQCDISFNTSDGPDLLYLNDKGFTGGSLTIKKSRMEGNNGNAVKGPNDMHIEDNIIVGNCGFFHGKSYTRTGFPDCRSLGDTVVVAWRAPSTTQPKIYSNTITGGGNVIFGLGRAESCPTGTPILVKNNLILGGKVFYDDTANNGAGGNKSISFWFNSDAEIDTKNPVTDCRPTIISEYNACTGVFASQGNCTTTSSQSGYEQTSSNSVYTTTPTNVFTGTISQGPTTYYTNTNYIDQLLIKVASIARDVSDETLVGATSVDFNTFERGASWDAGGFEYGTIGTVGGAADCPAETRSNCDLDVTSSGSSDGTCSSGYTGACSYSCTDGNWTLSSNTCVITPCGNVQIDSGEECDGLLLNGESCGSTGYSSCAGLPSCTNCVLTQGTCAAYACGNNCPDPGEQCDVGDTNNHDGCSSICETEVANYQHFKADYTEADTPAVLTVTTHKVQATGITHNADSSVRKDFGAGNFGNFTHRFKAQIDSCQDNGLGEDGGMAVWAMSGGSYGDLSEMETADDGIALKIKCFSSIERNTWELIEYE